MKTVNPKNSIEKIDNDYALTPVPPEKRKSGVNAMLVAAGWIIAMSSLFIGGTLGLSLNFGEAVIAAIIGQLILSIIGGLMAALGAKYGVSTTMLARQCYGKRGAGLFGLVLVLTLGIGWYAWQCAFFGMTINTMFSDFKLFLFDVRVASVWGGLLMMLTAYYGYRGLSYLSYVAIPMIVILCLFGATLAIEISGGFDKLLTAKPIGQPMSMVQAVTVVVGGAIGGAVCLADISRYVRGGALKGSLWTITGYFFGGAFCIIAGSAMTLGAQIPGIGNVADIPAVMKTLGLGLGALLVLIAAQWTTNDNNLYTGSLGLVNVINISKKQGVVIMGLIGIAIAAIGIQDYFVPFLLFLGTFIPPLAGVIIGDHWLVRNLIMKENYTFQDDTVYSELNIVALISALISGYISGYVIKVGYASIVSMIIAALLYMLLVIICRALNINYAIGKWVQRDQM